MIRRTLRTYRRLREDLDGARRHRELAGESGYVFSQDWVAPVQEGWESALDPYRAKPRVRMLEIGSFEGRSALWFLENVLTGPTASIVCVDVFRRPETEARFDHNVRISGAANKVTKLKGKSDAVVPTLPEQSFDLIYVDAGHHAVNVLMDAVLAWRRLKPGGTVIFDDYLWDLDKPPADRPQMAIDLFLDLIAGEYELVLKDYQVIVRRLS